MKYGSGDRIVVGQRNPSTMKGGSGIAAWVLVVEDAKGGTVTAHGSVDPRGLRGRLGNRHPSHATSLKSVDT